MVRILFCIAAMSISIAATAVAWAAPLDIVPGSAFRSGEPAGRYVRYEARKAAPPTARLRLQVGASSGPARAYLMRGFMNVFSLGMDDLAGEIQARGISAAVTNHADAEIVVNRIVADYAAGDRGPIVLIGHSLGADAVIAMAQALDRNDIPVALVILFDGTAPHAVPRNVATAINFTEHFTLTPGAEFRGTISNVDLSGDGRVDHLTIDKSPALHAQALDYVLQAASATPTPSARGP